MNRIGREQSAAWGRNSVEGGCGRPGRALWAVGLMALTMLVMLLPARASQAQDAAAKTIHEITWAHSSPAEVSRFVVFVSPEPAVVATAVQTSVPKPSGGDADLARIFSALVSVGINDYVAVAAIGQNGLRSIVSDWKQSQPSRPGQPLVVER